MNRTFTSIVLVALAGAVPGADRGSGCIDSRRVGFDEFTRGVFVSVPVTMPVPVGYELLSVKLPDDSYSYWMPPAEAERAVRTGDLPAKTGYMFAKLSRTMKYDDVSDEFRGESERAALERQGLTDIQYERTHVNGHAVLFLEAVDRKTGIKAYTMYVALNGDAAAMVAFMPPGNQKILGNCYWTYFKSVVKESRQPDVVPASP